MSEDRGNHEEKQAKPTEGRKETLYDMIPLTKKQLNVIIAVLAIALIVFIVIGALVGNGII